MYNFSTGPVALHPNVVNALTNPPISHRAPEGKALFQALTRKLCRVMEVKQTFVLTGSGTLANDAMLYQIKVGGGKGLILVNGEFGDRLVKQADLISLQYEVLEKKWGSAFCVDEIINLHLTHSFSWLLFCHCETSTGVMQPLEQLVEMGRKLQCRLYVDCMSTFGAMPLCLSGVTMATASSGKAIGSLAGLGLVFCNELINQQSGNMPRSLDLSYYQQQDGIPFTLSCPLLLALYKAIGLNLTVARWKGLTLQANAVGKWLKVRGMLLGSPENSKVFTLQIPDVSAQYIGDVLAAKGILVSYQSSYLLKRNWLQIALFGTYSSPTITFLLQTLEAVMDTLIPGNISAVSPTG